MAQTISRAFIGYLFSLTTLIISAQTIDPDELTLAIDNLIQPNTASGTFSGSILVAKGDDVLYQKAFGIANKEHEVPNRLDSRFGIGSITKMMTGIVVQQLVNEGKLDLNTTVEEFIEDFPKGPKGNAPRIEHLYNHTSGLPHRVTEQLDETQFISTSDLVERVKQIELSFKPGKKRQYSSVGYTVLARVSEIVEQKPFSKILEERIFVPANMMSARSENTLEPMIKKAYPYYLGTSNGNLVMLNAPFKDLNFLTGASAVYATVTDLQSFVSAIKAGTFGKETWTNLGTKSWSGWTGRTSGYEAYLDILPSEDIRLIILTNLRSAATWQIRSNLRKIITNEATSTIMNPPPIHKSFEQHEFLVGNYNSNGSTVKIKIERGRLYRGDNEFYPIEGEQYYIPASGTKMKFRRNDSGRVDAIIQIRGSNESLIPRID